MPDTTDTAVPRQPEEPTPQQVFDIMSICEPYTAGELAEQFTDASRWTIQRRLQTLHDNNKIERKEHAKNRVSWWRPASLESPDGQDASEDRGDSRD